MLDLRPNDKWFEELIATTKFHAEKKPRKCTGRKRISPKKQLLFSHKSASAYRDIEYLVGKKKQLLLEVYDKVEELKIKSS